MIDTLFRRLGIFLGLLVPVVAYAQVQEGIDVAGQQFLSFGGCSRGSCVVPIVELLIIGFRGVIAVWAVYTIVRMGFDMLTSQDEGVLDKAKKTIAAVAAGLILAVLPIERLVVGFLSIGTDPEAAAIQPVTEVYGIIRWALVMVAVVAVTVIIVNGLRAVLKYGSDEGVALMRRTVLSVAAGILLIIFSYAIKAALGVPDFGDLGVARPGPVAQAIVDVVAKLLLFAALIAVVVIIYAGITMIVFFGNEEKFTAARSLIIRVIIGLVIIAVAYLIVHFVIAAAVCGNDGCGI